MKVTIFGPNLRDQTKGQFHVHAADCADCAKYGPGGKYGGDDRGMTIEADSRFAVSAWLYDDHLSDYGWTAGSPEADAFFLDCLGDFHFAPCVQLPHRSPLVQVPPVCFNEGMDTDTHKEGTMKAFLAVAPDGSQHVRTSASRTYSHAILYGPDNDRPEWAAPKFSSRLDLAEKEAASSRVRSAQHRPEMQIVVVPVVEITPAQARKIKKGEILDLDDHLVPAPTFGENLPTVEDMTPLEVLRHHVTGAVERGEGEAIVEIPAPHPDEVAMGFATVPVGTDIDPAAMFLLDVNWPNMFEQQSTNDHVNYRCKLCQMEGVKVNEREAHFLVHKNDKTINAQKWADRRATMAAKTPKTNKQTAREQGVPEVYLSESGNFKPGMDARYKSDLISAMLGEENPKSLMTFARGDAHKRLEQRGWMGFYMKSKAAREARDAKKAAKATKAKTAASSKKAAARRPAAKSREAKPDPKPARKPRSDKGVRRTPKLEVVPDAPEAQVDEPVAAAS